MTNTKAIEFNKIDADSVDVIVDGENVGYMEREQDFTDVGLTTAVYRATGTTWHFYYVPDDESAWEDLENLGHLRTAKKAVRSFLESK